MQQITLKNISNVVIIYPVDGKLTSKTRKNKFYYQEMEKKMQENNNGVKVLIADQSQYVRMALERCINENNSNSLSVAGSAKDGLEAIELIHKTHPDVVVLDLVLQNVDGFGVMEAVNTMDKSERPEILVLSALSGDSVIARSMSLGAKYYMIKPFDEEVVVKRIKDMLSMSKSSEYQAAPSASEMSRGVDEKIATLFLTIGIPAHIKGYQFLREAVKLVISSPDVINRITKELYPTIARRFDTTASKVERAIRHAIEVAWNRGRIEQVNRIFGHCVYTPNDKPTNGEFIALIADKLSYDRTA